MSDSLPTPARSVVAEYQRAEAAADQMDMALQFGIPDLKKLLRGAYVLGYVDGARGATVEQP